MPMTATSTLLPEEAAWREVFENLRNRFPTVSPERVAQILRSCDGHAGSAAAELRNITGSTVKPPDPDDAEHVATLLSSPAMFKHACKEQFQKFDVNGNGVLELGEVLELTNELYYSFGLQQPSEGSIRAFFASTDENQDGVLSEREFTQFFEMFLRYSFFDVVKLRQLVEQGNGRRLSAGGNGNEPDSHSFPAGTPTALQRTHSSPLPSPGRRYEPEGDRSRGAARRDRHAREQEGAEELEDVPSQPSSVYKCVAKHGVSYRRTPDHSDRADSVVQYGERVHVLEHWVRTPQGWLPVEDARGLALFERSGSKSRDKASRSRGDRADRGDRVEPRRASDREERGHPAPPPPESPPNVDAGPAPPRPSHTDDLGERASRSSATKEKKSSSKRTSFMPDPPRASAELQPEEEEWRERYERLKERFPQVPPEQVLGVLRAVSGHAGKAATKLRDL